MVNTVDAALAAQLREFDAHRKSLQRTGSAEAASAAATAPVTPLSPVAAVGSRATLLRAHEVFGAPVLAAPHADEHETKKILSDEVRYGHPGVQTGADGFLSALDGNDAHGLVKFANRTLLNALYPGKWCKQPAAIRALSMGCLAAFFALIDCGADLKKPDKHMLTVAMCVHIYALRGKKVLASELEARRIVLDRAVPVDKNHRNVLWYLVNRGIKEFETAEYQDLLFKIGALKKYGASAIEKDRFGVSPIDLAEQKYGKESAVVAALKE
jgi:hypothetical protein